MKKSTEEDDRVYTCAECGNSYPFGWTDKEARREAVERFGPDVFNEPVDIVCDGCYRKIFACLRADD